MPLKEQLAAYNLTALPAKFILIGEDDIDDVDMLREVFSAVDKSFSLFFFHNGLQVMEILDQTPPDNLPCLILLDYNMPGMSGAEILGAIKDSGRYGDVPKVIWSTSASEVYRKRCLELGANDYVIKPSSLQEFTDVAKHMLTFCSC